MCRIYTSYFFSSFFSCTPPFLVLVSCLKYSPSGEENVAKSWRHNSDTGEEVIVRTKE